MYIEYTDYYILIRIIGIVNKDLILLRVLRLPNIGQFLSISDMLHLGC